MDLRAGTEPGQATAASSAAVTYPYPARGASEATSWYYCYSKLLDAFAETVSFSAAAAAAAAAVVAETVELMVDLLIHFGSVGAGLVLESVHAAVADDHAGFPVPVPAAVVVMPVALRYASAGLRYWRNPQDQNQI